MSVKHLKSSLILITFISRLAYSTESCNLLKPFVEALKKDSQKYPLVYLASAPKFSELVTQGKPIILRQKFMIMGSPGKSLLCDIILNHGKKGEEPVILEQSANITSDGSVEKYGHVNIREISSDEERNTFSALFKELAKVNGDGGDKICEAQVKTKKLEPIPNPPMPQEKIQKIYNHAIPARLTKFNIAFFKLSDQFHSEEIAYAEIAKVAKYLALHSTIEITLVGNIDGGRTPAGPVFWNEKYTPRSSDEMQFKFSTVGELMDARNQQVMNAFIRFGISPKRVTLKRGDGTGMRVDILY